MMSMLWHSGGVCPARIERVDGNEPTPCNVGHRLGRHDPDAESGVAARPSAHGDGVKVASRPVLLGEQRGHGGREIACVVPTRFERGACDEAVTEREADKARLV